MWPEHWPIVMCFIHCATQWDIVVSVGAGGYKGFRYEGVKVVLDFMEQDGEFRIPLDPEERSLTRSEVFAGVQIMEYAALKVLNNGSR